MTVSPNWSLEQNKRGDFIRMAAKMRRHQALDLYESSPSMTYTDVGIVIGLTRNYVGEMIIRARLEREWDLRQAARRG